MTTLNRQARHADGTAVLLSVVLERNARESLGRQLYLRIGEYIRSGRLAAGTRLTSTRRLSQDLGVSRTVTLSAYDQLASEGYIEPLRGSGMYVRSLSEAGNAGRGRIDPPMIGQNDKPESVVEGRPFDPTAQVEGIFPTSTWIRLLGRSWRREGSQAQAPGNWAGLPSLREAIAHYVYSLRGIACTSKQILITSGTADALQLIVQTLAPNTADKKCGVWIEDPGYLNARKVLSDSGMRLIPVPVDEFGIDVAAGRHKEEKARFALVTPSRQFPLGMPLSLDRRLALVSWARANGVILIEDDYDTEVRFGGRPIASLLSFHPQLRALSLGSFSKLAFPGLRLGYIVGDKHLIERLADFRRRSGAPIATTAQPALAAFLADSAFARHLRRLRREVTTRREALVTALTTRLPEQVTILPQEVGMHLTVTLKRKSLRDTVLSAKAAIRGLHLQPLSAHYARANRQQNGFLLGYAGWSKSELASAVSELCKLLS